MLLHYCRTLIATYITKTFVQVGGPVTFTTDFNETMKNKSVYLMRRMAIPIQRDNFRYVLIAGDLSASTFGHLSSFVNEV